jgi:hypothetical protein
MEPKPIVKKSVSPLPLLAVAAVVIAAMATGLILAGKKSAAPEIPPKEKEKETPAA